MLNGVKVKLKSDLTSYGKGLVIGTEGVTCYSNSIDTRNGAVGVMFNNGIKLDVYPSSLEIIDNDYLDHLDKEKQARFKDLKNSTNISVVYGRYGGFKSLSYKCGITSMTYSGGTFKKEALEILDFFKKECLPIKESIE